MSRLLGAFVLAAALSACTTQTPAAQPPSTVTTTTTVTTTSPRIDTPRKLAGFDPCRLLQAADFDEPLFEPPAPHPSVPNSCSFRVGSGANTDLIVIAAVDGPYEKPEKATELLLTGHTAAMTCAGRDPIIECTMRIAVSQNETIKIIVHLEGANTAQVSQILHGKASRALGRLPQ